jgi:hypothetical protein
MSLDMENYEYKVNYQLPTLPQSLNIKQNALKYVHTDDSPNFLFFLKKTNHRNRDSSVDPVTRLRNGRPKNRGSTLGKVRRFFSSAKLPARL